MKRLLKSGRIAAALAFAGATLLAGCGYDDSDLVASVDDLKGRVTALEEAAKEAQRDIDALKTLVEALENRVGVTSVTEQAGGGYVIRFTDGTTVTISDGQRGEDGITPPTLSVVEEDGNYYWVYRNADGTTTYLTDDSGRKIQANGGAAPQVRINGESGEWEISTDGGANWTSTGVKAAGSGDPLFRTVDFDDDYLYVTLADGTQLKLAIVPELRLAFASESETFAYGEEKLIGVTASGAAKYSLSKPEGWRASLTDEGLTITAPVEENVFAETAGEITVVAVAENGYGAIASLRVAIAVPAKIGDYFYADGTWSDGGLISIEADGLNAVWAEEKPAPKAGKRVIGIVCQTFPERIAESDKAAGYTRGYVMCVKTAHGSDKETTWWGADWEFSCLKSCKVASTWYNNVNGYAETHTVAENYGDDLAAMMPAFDLVLNGFPVEAPASTSGWFLPSTGQLWDLTANLCGAEVAAVMKGWQTLGRDATWYCSEKVSYDVIARFNASMEKVPAEDKEELGVITPTKTYGSMWTSTPYDAESADQINIGTDGLVECMCDWYNGDAVARPILAF